MMKGVLAAGLSILVAFGPAVPAAHAAVAAAAAAPVAPVFPVVLPMASVGQSLSQGLITMNPALPSVGLGSMSLPVTPALTTALPQAEVHPALTPSAKPLAAAPAAMPPRQGEASPARNAPIQVQARSMPAPAGQSLRPASHRREAPRARADEGKDVPQPLEQAQAIGAKLSDGKAVGWELDGLYDGSLQRPDSKTDAVPAAPGGAQVSPAGLTASPAGMEEADAAKQAPPAPEEKGPRFRIPAWAGSTGIVGLTGALGLAAYLFIPDPMTALYVTGAVAVAGLAALAYYLHAAQRGREWSGSKSAGDVQAVAAAFQAGDQAALETLLKQAMERRGRMEARIGQAESQKSRRVDDSSRDSVSKARRLASYDAVVVVRALLALDAVSKDPSRRFTGRTLDEWKSRLAADEKAALASKFEGRLALTLEDMHQEDERSEREYQRLLGYVEDFKKAVPAAFGGQLREELDRTVRGLEQLRKTELDGEDALYAEVASRMRRRTSDKLYSQRKDFQQHRDHFDSLAGFYARHAYPAMSTAERIDSDLSSMKSSLLAAELNYGLAAANTHVPVTKWRTVPDGKGGTRQESYIVYEDHSAMYRALAAAAQASASASASAARAGLQDLQGMMASLAQDPMIASENLGVLVPRGAGVDVRDGGIFSVFAAAMLPPLFNLFGGLFSISSADSARSAFQPVLALLQALAREVASRRNGEDGWVQGQISADLSAQMDEARGQKAPNP